MRGSVFEYEWLVDNTPAVHKRWYLDTPGGKDRVDRIKKAWLDGKTEEVASDSVKIAARRKAAEAATTYIGASCLQG